MGQNRVKPPPPSESLLNRARLRTAQRHGTPFAATVGPPRDETSLEQAIKSLARPFNRETKDSGQPSTSAPTPPSSTVPDVKAARATRNGWTPADGGGARRSAAVGRIGA